MFDSGFSGCKSVVSHFAGHVVATGGVDVKVSSRSHNPVGLVVAL